jgi:hypothetical protein
MADAGDAQDHGLPLTSGPTRSDNTPMMEANMRVVVGVGGCPGDRHDDSRAKIYNNIRYLKQINTL